MKTSESELSVFVDNVGEVLKTRCANEASDIYRHYCELSDAGKGRAGGETVTLYRGEDIVLEHQGFRERLDAIDAGFMQSDIMPGDFWDIETSTGSSCILPADLVTLPDSRVDESNDANGEKRALFLDYIPESCYPCKEPADIVSAERKTGYGARLSAPGYLDCTEWTLFDTELEAIKYIVETYGEDG